MMEDIKRYENNARISAWSFVGIVILLLLALLSSCKTHRIVEHINTHDTLTIYQRQKDSIIQRDSVFMNTYIKGDTVYNMKYIEHNFYHDRLSHDSIYIHLTDTIVKMVPVEVATKKSWWQEVKMHVGGICLWALLFFLGFQLWRWYKGK